MTAIAEHEIVRVPGRSWFARHRGAVVRHAIIIFFMVLILAPLAWVLLLSVKSMPDAIRGQIWPRNFDFSHYGYVWWRIETLPRNAWNSIYVTFATVILTTTFATMAGYAMVHLKPSGRMVLFAVLLSSLYFPTRVVAIISIYEIQDALDLLNNTSGLILPYVAMNLAVSVMIMRSVFQLVPHQVIESARLDGAGPWRTLLLIGLPLVRNGLVVVIVINFVAAWGEFLLAATLTNDQAARTVPVVLAQASGGTGQWAWPRIAAVYVLVVMPGLVTFTFAQKLFFKGMSEGMVKG